MQTFACPTCGGPLEHRGGPEKTIRCPFCMNSVIVPKELRSPTAQLPYQLPPSRRLNPLWIALPIFFVVIGLIIAGMVLTLMPSRRQPPQPPIEISPPRIAVTPPAKTTSPPDSGFATVAMTFGSEGIGPGLFTDARSIAVDGAGRIYVGEYGSGRIQVFDPQGKFITQWMADTKMPLRGMAADRAGTVYIAQRGVLSRYDGATGKPTGQMDYPGGRGFDDVAVTADGGLLAAWEPYGSGISFGTAGDNLVRFDANGRTLRTIKNAVSTQTDNAELEMRVAIDGLGNIYALGQFSNAVFKFTPEGKFVNRFGSRGDQVGQLTAPQAIAVDGQGRVYVSDLSTGQKLNNLSKCKLLSRTRQVA
jgi:DNA-binding beta-propeller fold protein YncE